MVMLGVSGPRFGILNLPFVSSFVSSHRCEQWTFSGEHRNYKSRHETEMIACSAF
jgi:hypothetical protein